MVPPSTSTSRKIVVVQESQLSLTQCDTSGSNTQETQCNTSETNTQEAHLSYRQNRRLQQAKRAESATGYYKRGPSRGLKSRRWREKHPTIKPTAKISDSMRRVIGERSAEFISDCSRWVREYCPLKARNWVMMDSECKERLYSKIQGEWTLPKFVDGVDVKVILNSQCAALYRGWRYRLKERYYHGYSKAAAKANKPPEIDANEWNWLIDHYWSDPKSQSISEKNKIARLKQTINHSNGAKSTARILDEMMNELPSTPQGSQQAGEEGCEQESQTRIDEEPLYVRLYERTHRHANRGLDPEAETNLQALKDLHHKEIEENGVDNLTPQEAYPRVFKSCNGYIRGFGFGPRCSKRVSNGAAEVREEMQQMEQASAEREAALRGEIERLKQEMVDRENKLRQEMMAEIARMMRGST